MNITRGIWLEVLASLAILMLVSSYAEDSNHSSRNPTSSLFSLIMLVTATLGLTAAVSCVVRQRRGLTSSRAKGCG